jgi:putative FmdB family regulatory protein
MPTYDYECDACGHEFELFQGINDPVQRKCPDCGKLKLRRLFGTGAAVVFKGSGFYQTDYRSESYKKAAEKDKPASDSGEKSKSGGGASKASGGEKSAKTDSKSKSKKE